MFFCLSLLLCGVNRFLVIPAKFLAPLCCLLYDFILLLVLYCDPCVFASYRLSSHSRDLVCNSLIISRNLLIISQQMLKSLTWLCGCCTIAPSNDAIKIQQVFQSRK